MLIFFILTLFQIIFLVLIPLILLAIRVLFILIISPLKLILVILLKIPIHLFIVLSLIFIILLFLRSKNLNPYYLLCSLAESSYCPNPYYYLLKVKFTFDKNRSYCGLLSELLRKSQAPITRLNCSSELENKSGSSCSVKI